MTKVQENITKKERAKEARDDMNLFLSTLQIAMKNMGIAIGWDKERDKLVLLHNKTKIVSRVDLEELNGKVFVEGEDKDGTN